MRLLLNLNENQYGAHANIHHSLEKLKSRGSLSDYIIYPFPARLADGLSSDQVLSEIVEKAERFQPDAVLWSHTGNLFVGHQVMARLNSTKANPSIGYWDGDVWQKPLPAPKEVFELCTGCDVVFCQGAGDFSSSLKKIGCKDVRYVPAASDELRFFKTRLPSKEIIYDVVVIGNNVTSLLPWRTAPGSILRKKIAKLFSKKLGERFGIFGQGWKEAYGKGPITFTEQVNLYHSSRIALGTNNWLGPKYYFSNRLPIAMSSGVPVVYNYEDGFNEMLGAKSGVIFYRDANEAWKICEKLLEKTQQELDEIGLKSYNFAWENLHLDKILMYMIDVLAAHHQAKVKGTSVPVIENPWIKEAVL